MYSTKLCSTKSGKVPGPTPWLFSDGRTTFRRWLSSQLISAAPMRPLPQVMVPVAASAFGTLIVTGLRVLKFSVTPNLGLMPPGLANFQKSASWKALVTWTVPIFVPPNVKLAFLTIGEFCTRVSALAPESQLSFLVGSQVSPLENFMTSGTISAVMVDAGLLVLIAGFLPTIVYVKVLLPTFTLAV